MRDFGKLLFGPAGVPHSSPRSSSESGVRQVHALGLSAMELAFVRGVRMGAKTAEKVRQAAEETGVVLTVHAPYYINLLSVEKDKVEASMKRILDAARVGAMCGAVSVTFHPGTYGPYTPREALRVVADRMREILDVLAEEGISVDIRPETQGKPAQFGSLEELLELSQLVPGLSVCVDFAHLHARTNGQYNTPGEWHRVLDQVADALGEEALRTMHIHISGIVYSEKGERHHVNLEESDFRFREWMAVLKERDIHGVVISESPNLEGDALLLQELYVPG